MIKIIAFKDKFFVSTLNAEDAFTSRIRVDTNNAGFKKPASFTLLELSHHRQRRFLNNYRLSIIVNQFKGSNRAKDKKSSPFSHLFNSIKV
jgi:hypothetical protein